MQKSGNLNVRIDPEVKMQAEEIFKTIGISMSSALNIILKECIHRKGFPFPLIAHDFDGPSQEINK